MKLLILLSSILLGLAAQAQVDAGSALVAKATKLIVVTTPGWNSVDGRLVRYQKSHNKWKQVGDPVPIVVGKNGMAWDPALATGNAPVKHEGDGRSPAGIYPIDQTFGFAPSLGASKNYLSLTPAIECVDDVNSSHYAHIANNEQVSPDWNSSEHMRSIEAYRWGAIVPYNMSSTRPGAGSCIFLHVWSGAGKGTAGCTAMPENTMSEMVRWINSKGRTVLVQMPAAEYDRLKQTLGTP
jgi:L,D-peptidoglycan transpeptidase YkuD (ErfK/YbiS/YcfS/YnhG family)